ncbi:S41 family peptidase [soil metagenome]
MSITTRLALLGSVALLGAGGTAAAQTPGQTPGPRILQQPAISRDLVAFGYAGDIWTVPRAGGRAVRLTTGVGIESAPIFSPDGATIAFTGEYDGNVDVFTVPVSGGTPHRVTYHPGADSAVGWSADGKSILFRSNRTAASRYTQIFSVSAQGGVPKALPLPMAFSGQMTADGSKIAYNPLAPAFSFDFTSYVAWGNYRGGRAGSVWITSLPGLDSVQVPHEAAADFSPVWVGGKLYFLSGRKGAVGVFAYDPASKAVTEVFHNTGSDIRSLSTDGRTLIFDKLGELFTLEPGGAPQKLSIEVAGDMPDVRPRILNVSDQVEHVSISPTGLRAVVEAHGDILTVPAKRGAMRNVTGTSGVAEREPAWSPDGQSIAYFSDESGLYALHVASQTGAREEGAKAVKKFPLAREPAYYFSPLWSPDSKKIAFYDNRLKSWVLDLVTGKLSQLGTGDTFGGFSAEVHGMAWSPDSRWLVYPRSMPNHLHSLMLWSQATGAATQITDTMADAKAPAFDRNGKYLYFLASSDAGATGFGLDMSTDLYSPVSTIYALSLKADTASPIAPEAEDEKSPAEAKEKSKEGADATPAGQAGEAKAAAKAQPRTEATAPAPKLTGVDIAGLSLDQIALRMAPLPLPPRAYDNLQAGKPGVLYFVERPDGRSRGGDQSGASLNRYVIDDRKSEKLADRVADYELTADGEKMLLATTAAPPPGGPAPGGPPRKPTYQVVPANVPVKAPTDGALSLAGLEVRVYPAAEWRQMYKEVWRIERAYFYDPAFNGVNTVAEEKRLEPYVGALQSRSDLNYVFQEMLTGFSVGHLRGTGGAIPSARKVPGGLLGADYEVKNGRWCLAKIYTGGTWSPDVKAPLAQPGLNIKAGECIIAIDGEALSADVDIQKPLDGTAGHAVSLRIASAAAAARDVTVIPVASEYALRNTDWIDSNQRRVSELSGGKLAYVYLPDTGNGGFMNFNRYYFAQSDKQGAIIDERFNGGGQMADYIIEVLGRKIVGYWQPRYGAVDHTPSAGIYGPKVMIANEVSGSGGDAMPWLFKHNQLGPLVGKRTWGGLVGIGAIPVLMDGGNVTSPSVGFFSPAGAWDVENHGVEPDYPVEQDPKLVASGHDPQLEAAVSLALSKLGKPDSPKTPTFPNYTRP